MSNMVVIPALILSKQLHGVSFVNTYGSFDSRHLKPNQANSVTNVNASVTRESSFDGQRDNEVFALKRFHDAYDIVRRATSRLLFKRTPLIAHWKDAGDLSVLSEECDLYLKLENTQVTGSYKVRGVLNQLHQFLQRVSRQQQQRRQLSNEVVATDGDASSGGCDEMAHNSIGLVTMSAGNYGKAFAYITAAMTNADGETDELVNGINARSLIGRRLVVMPSSAPANRQAVIESLAAEVRRVPTTELVETVNNITNDGTFYFMQSINDDDLILGHGSIGLELLEDLPDPDVVIVPCGGGALLASVAATIKQSLKGKKNCRVYGVEPVEANTMWQSMRVGEPVSMPTARSIAAGLAPPYAGDASYRLCRQYVDDIILVPDSLIARAVTQLYNQGFVVEPSGSVGYAALSEGLVPDVTGRKVVLLFSGGNIVIDDMVKIFDMVRS